MTRTYFLQRFFHKSPFLFIQNKLKERRLRSLEAQLPPYIQKISYGLNEYTIYKAKKENTSEWDNMALKRLVIECRKSYKDYYYSQIPDLDKDDDISSVYLVGVSFPVVLKSSKTIIAKKWYSLRFVFPQQIPTEHSIDLEIYKVKNQNKEKSVIESIEEKMQEYKGISQEEIKKHIVIISRFCSTGVYIISDSPEVPPIIERHISQQKFHGGISFTLMNKFFLHETEKKSKDIDLFVTQMHDILSDKVLAFLPNGEKRNLSLPYAYQTLGVHASDIHIDRKKYGLYIYRYPGYFLDCTELAAALEKLVLSKRVSVKTIEKYLETGTSFSDILKSPKIFHFRKFGDLFTVSGYIPGEQMTGEELREFLNAQVSDGPHLRLFNKETWGKIIAEYLDNAQITI